MKSINRTAATLVILAGIVAAIFVGHTSETQRSTSALMTLYADNAAGDISPQDLRDFVETYKGARGGMSIDSSAATTISTPGTFVKAAGTTQAISTPQKMTVATDNRITYTGVADICGCVLVSASVTAGTNNTVMQAAVYKNGSPISNVNNIHRKISTGTDVGAIAITAPVQLSTNDYIELWVTLDAASTVTIEQLNFSISGHTL